ncbi:MAG: Fe-S cluster assembly protein SufB [Patescibacteria group bacterium]
MKEVLQNNNKTNIKIQESLKDEYKFGFRTKSKYTFKAKKGLNKDIVAEISYMKNEPQWMRDFRLKSYDVFLSKPMPLWGADLSDIDFEDFYYFLRAQENSAKDWSDVSPEIKETFDKLGVPEAERRFLAGVGAQFESEVVYHSILKELEDKGVIFTDMDSAVQQYPDIVKKYFGTIIPPYDNKFAALNSAVWSGGSFVYVPKGVKVETPLQAYFRINARAMGQFERTLIVAEKGSSIHYLEGCSAPIYDKNSLHSAVVEIVCKENSNVRYTTIQNWSKNVYNLVTKRAMAYKNAKMFWVDGNFGSKVTMKYPSVYLMEDGAHGEVLSIASASSNQHIDAGSKIIHAASNTTSRVISKSISRDGGRTTYRGLLKAENNIEKMRADVVCDALLMDSHSRTDTYPTIDVDNAKKPLIQHEASVSKIGEDQLFYLESRGLDYNEATSLIVSGFLEPIARELPMEYAVELNRLIKLEMENSVG